MSTARQMSLGLSMRYHGYHVAAWRHPDYVPGCNVDFSAYRDVARHAEAEKLDMIFFADGVAVRGTDTPEGALSHDMKNAELEPLTLLSAIAACTSDIGLVATASTTYNEPYHVARKYASLDHISGGRAGWNVVTSWSDQEALNFNRTENLAREERYARAAEFVDVVKGLWRSWEADAFTHDKAGGQFYDPAKLHVLNHKGPFFQVRGPLNSCRTPQGEPVIVQAGASNQGRDIAARHAHVVYSVSQTVEHAREFYADLKARAAGMGRTGAAPLIMPGITLYVGATQEEAQAKFDTLQALIDPLAGLALLYTFCGDLSGHDVDGPVPFDALPQGGIISIGAGLLAEAKAGNLTIRQLYERVAAGFTGRFLIGTPESIVDDMQMWFETGAADGFNICPPMLAQGMQDMSDYILPELRRRGLFRTDYPGTTLRETLGLA
ncbi:LLM class flavin-dependent oxidoreductase (plasmid) [Paroceanicella profunda]|uniref:LLM class flavin-dependent oxidoreductase n=1 Tax=Paroceanicella profunda TaxID=2579971 RepID=A0A5B8G3D1_9RHOB|nr:LLM class flavin-dependent oxidoreductase [Paroceanicella profunda]QDL94624.1 LLM class flavin-dependent oxidoreductase [Paroceanicella profunda]